MWRSVKNFLLRLIPLPLRPRYILELRARKGQWHRLRKEHLCKEPACVACGRENNLEVHHIIPVHINPNRELDPDNLITLCAEKCHLVFGHFMSYHCYNSDVRKMAAEYRRKLNKRSCHTNF